MTRHTKLQNLPVIILKEHPISLKQYLKEGDGPSVSIRSKRRELTQKADLTEISSNVPVTGVFLVFWC
ncbi:hypothetical protein L6164_007009 [Bauhinia variegata]|uniref:Uncharacterized protein n=1 Tax=Bauhinia variegata TaxID=167791 RepID=A0ACB9PY10_BAUVA|nr:hypothetical protein L6164_007009 [Bauhinia variegata]